MANRDQPVNGRNTMLSLLDSGNLVLIDGGEFIVWNSGTESSSVQLQLHDNGNLVLKETNGVGIIWQSFDSPTNTLLPQQLLTRKAILISSRSLTNYTSGFYKLYFDNDNILRLLYDDGVEITSVFWPTPWLASWEARRDTYNNSRIAMLDLLGNSSTLEKGKLKIWTVTWQISLQPCKTHGICGANGLCTYVPESGPRCDCLPGYKMKDSMDWSQGCVPDNFKLFSCEERNDSTSYFVQLNHVEFYGYDIGIGYYKNYTLEECKRLCLSHCDCKGFQFKFEWDTGYYSCFPKRLLFNGYQSIDFKDWMHIRLPKTKSVAAKKEFHHHLQCTNGFTQMIKRTYKKKQDSTWLKPLGWCSGVIGAFEVICWLVFMYKTRQRSSTTSDYLQVAATGFRRFTYAELKKASRNFSEEIGRGGSGVVYKGKLSDERIAAIKCLNEAKQGEAEFLAEVSTIGRLNHGYLIDRWGYCAQGKHRLLVYEYLENGSLAENLYSNKLDWNQRFDIALGTAKGLAYLHEECLEWVLHCDVKPQNILLDSNYQPKVADFGLSKILKKWNGGYFMGTGTSPNGQFNSELNYDHLGDEQKRIVNWIRNKMHEDERPLSCIEKIVGTSMEGGEIDVKKLENLVKVALQCAEENKDARPTMRQVVDMLLRQDI
ncbi:hypothetical protein RD792_017590 [Penstemon davidsonii]|uniref:non-specific serine/threonine protein kinase n=1 Tax=Penstemon davidsonii TaxID=160366 RepID=A0ABR0CP59_9LAMI|nr:hypothetical protein RD792_017590 [Penstemon davidsonii]